MSGRLIQLIYASSARELMSEAALLELLDVSRRNNRQRDITGILLYRGGNFLQVLEGPEREVDALYQTITKDERHSGVLLIARRAIETRDFPDWEMSFVNLESMNAEDVPGYSTLLSEPFDGESFVKRPSLAYHFVNVFKTHIR